MVLTATMVGSCILSLLNAYTKIGNIGVVDDFGEIIIKDNAF